MGFLEKQTDPTSPMHWRGDMQADYFYPSGIAGDKFFKHIKQNDTFLATKCPKCEMTLFPPRLYCEDCFEEISDSNWLEIPATGTIRLFTIAKINAQGKKMETPNGKTQLTWKWTRFETTKCSKTEEKQFRREAK